jgi:hypothetical protein
MTKATGFARLALCLVVLAGCEPTLKMTPPARVSNLGVSVSGQATVGDTLTA